MSINESQKKIKNLLIMITRDRLYVVCVILGFSFQCLFSLSNQALSQVPSEMWYNSVAVPPSPNAASLGKYCEVPVDKSTGVPNINIPLIDLNEGGIDLSISVSYHAGGIRVQDEATFVGLGWSLNAGGVITRTMRGLPDDMNNGYIQNSERVPWSNIIDIELGIPSSSYPFGIADKSYERLDQMAKGEIDYEPDIFYYNVGGLNGSFMFDNHKNPVTIPYADVEIEPIYENGIITGFILSGPDGLDYIYGHGYATETTHADVRGPDQPAYISSWYLTQIINPMTSSSIEFIYGSYSHTSSVSYSSTKLYEKQLINYELVDAQPSSLTTTINDAKYLTRIEFSNGIISFDSSPTEDGGMKLDEITFNYKTFKFYYDYFKVHPNSTSKNELRLRLDSIIEFVPNNPSKGINEDITAKRFSFEYSSVNLPPKDSKSIDFWGFYNGKNTSAESTIPYLEYAGQAFGDADRNPDSQYTQAGILKKISYPTGATSEFIYENNAYSRLPTIDEISISESTPLPYYHVTGIGDDEEKCEFAPIVYEPNYNYYGYVLHSWVSYVNQPIHINDNAHVNFYYDFTKTIPDPCATIPIDNTVEQDFDILCDPGTLLMELCAKGANTTVWANLSYKKYDPIELTKEREFLVGGLRIKQIKNYDNLTGTTLLKTFDYDKSGYLVCESTPEYYTTGYEKRVNQANHLVDVPRLMIYSTPVGGLGNSSSGVSYERVIEYNGTIENNNGKMITTFLKYTDDPSGGVPYIPTINYAFMRSKVVGEEFYSLEANGDFSLKKKVEYTFQSDTSHLNLIRGFKASRIATINVNVIPHLQTYYSEEFSYLNFIISALNKRLDQVVTHDYTNNGEIVSTQTYYYENPRHLNPTKIITGLSDGRVKSEVFKYPMDFIPFQCNCDHKYEEDLDACRLANQEWATAVGDCESIYGSCYINLLTDADQAVECYYNDPLAYFTDYTLCSKRCEAYRDPWKNFDDCLNESNYNACLNNLYCGYIPCEIAANNNYNLCIQNYNSSILELYESEVDPIMKGIYLLAAAGFDNTLIEKVTSIDNEEIEHLRFNYNKAASTERPLMVSAERSIMEGDFDLGISYDNFDNSCNVLQATPRGIGPSTSYVWGYHSKYLIAKIDNATSNECGYSGFELNETNSFSLSSTADYSWSLDSHTGNMALKMLSGIGASSTFLVGDLATKHSGYKASVWVKGSKSAYIHIEVNGVWSSHVRKSNEFDDGDWHLLEVELPMQVLAQYQSSGLQIKVYIGVGDAPAIFDDLRFYPMDAQMTTYSYKPYVGITSSSDANNKPVYNVYDLFDRLILIKDFEGNILKKYDYHYR